MADESKSSGGQRGRQETAAYRISNEPVAMVDGWPTPESTMLAQHEEVKAADTRPGTLLVTP